MQPQAEQVSEKPLDLTPVKIACLAEYWDEAWSLLEPAVARNGLYTKASVMVALLAGEFQLWVVEDDRMHMAVITEIAEYPALKIGTILFVGGDEYPRCLEFIDYIEKWSKECGCSRFICTGREGFSRRLERRGYRKTLVTMVKDFYDG